MAHIFNFMVLKRFVFDFLFFFFISIKRMSSKYKIQLFSISTVRRYASAVCTMALCLSVCLSVRMCHKSEFYFLVYDDANNAAR